MPPIAKPYSLINDDCREYLPRLPANFVDAVVTDPPYELGFMGKKWDSTGVAFDSDTWRAVLRVIKPGGYLLAMGGTRTYHRLTCAVEDSGFEVRDCLLWLYGTGFPKGKGCLKPAWEPILLARKPGPRVLPLGIDECRVPTGENCERTPTPRRSNVYAQDDHTKGMLHGGRGHEAGRYPANLCHDGSLEVIEAFAAFGERDSGGPSRKASGYYKRPGDGGGYHGVRTDDGQLNAYADSGTAARFFYCAKASKAERGEYNTHPTVKPLALMRWLVRLVCLEKGKVLDPFMGSGTTGKACGLEKRSFVGVEQSKEGNDFEIACKRIREGYEI